MLTNRWLGHYGSWLFCGEMWGHTPHLRPSVILPHRISSGLREMPNQVEIQVNYLSKSHLLLKWLSQLRQVISNFCSNYLKKRLYFPHHTALGDHGDKTLYASLFKFFFLWKFPNTHNDMEYNNPVCLSPGSNDRQHFARLVNLSLPPLSFCGNFKVNFRRYTSIPQYEPRKFLTGKL